MGIGYIFGCLLSVLFWSIDRENIVVRLAKKINKRVTYTQFVVIAFIFTVLLGVGLFIIEREFLHNRYDIMEIYNFIVAFIVIDLSNADKKSIERTEDKKHFYDTISLLSKGFVCGFIAPLFYIIIMGNYMAIIYATVYAIYRLEDNKLFRIAHIILNFVPSMIALIILYPVYLIRNKKWNVEFNGEFLENLISSPILNVDIMAAHIEGINFYHYYYNNGVPFIKSYGKSQNKIGEALIKDYVGLIYGGCIVVFLVFLSIKVV